MNYLPGGRQAYGAEFLAHAAAGTSDGKSFPAIDFVARGAANERNQLLAVGLGPAWFRWIGSRSFVSVNSTAMLGVERLDGTSLGLSTLRAGLGGGVALRQSTSTWGSFMLPAMRFTQFPEVESLMRDTTALTFELTGALDAPFTRLPQQSLGILIGIAWLHERFSRELPPQRRNPLILLPPR
ncbi:MAG: hypothetical protein ACOY0T_39895 [Myxococcota bacterium]